MLESISIYQKDKGRYSDNIDTYSNHSDNDIDNDSDIDSDEEISIELNNNKDNKDINKREGYKIQYNGSIPLPNKYIKNDNITWKDLLFSCFKCFKWRREGNESEFIKLNNRINT